MPKRARQKPLDDSILKSIYDWFFKPLVDSQPDPEGMAHSYMEKLFDVENRSFSQWKCIKAFKMPGLCYAAGAVKVQGIGYRRVHRNSLLMVREDTRAPDTVDVEFFGGRGKKEQVFCLTRSEWNWVKLHLRQEEYDASKPRHRNRLRGRKLRRLDQETGQQGQGEEGAL